MSDSEHDDFGGLQRDLLATGRAMPRRDALRIAAKLGVGAGALQLLGCGGETEVAHRAGHDDGYDARGVRLVQPDPGGDRRAVSGRRVERPERAERGGRRPRRHPLELRRAQRHGRRRASDRGADHRLGVDVRAARRPRRLHLALRPGGTLLALRLRAREPELPARRAGRRTRAEGSRSPRSSPAAMPAAGRTSTSRSSPASPRRRAPRTGSRRRRSRCPRRPATPSTRRAAIRRA